MVVRHAPQPDAVPREKRRALWRGAWRNLDTDAKFCSMFRHRGGNHYLIFRTELYGYSVLEMEEIHHGTNYFTPYGGAAVRR